MRNELTRIRFETIGSLVAFVSDVCRHDEIGVFTLLRDVLEVVRRVRGNRPDDDMLTDADYRLILEGVLGRLLEELEKPA